jgi:hypothetical protein
MYQPTDLTVALAGYHYSKGIGFPGTQDKAGLGEHEVGLRDLDRKGRH